MATDLSTETVETGGKREVIILAVVALVTLTLVVAVSHRYQLYKQKNAAMLRPEIINAAPAKILAGVSDFQGDSASPFTLVEFSDYQCPPCRFAHPQLKPLLARFSGKLRLAVRQFPLPMHYFAMPAAIAAEAAREQGKFWTVSDALFESKSLDDSAIKGIVAAAHVDRSRYDKSVKTTAVAKVKSDMQLCDSLKLTGTPTFLLCCPNGKVFHLAKLEQVAIAMRQ